MNSSGKRPRGTATFSKPPLSHSQMLTLLKSRDLIVADDEKALRYLAFLGYYRLSPYMIPFKLDGSDKFKSGTTFDNVLEFYVFDRKLRLLVTDAIERVEVALRACLTDNMAKNHGAFWYTKSALFSDSSKHEYLLNEIRRICDAKLNLRAETPDGRLHHLSALEHYLINYGNPELPPAWLIMEEITLGQLIALILNLKDTNSQAEIAKKLGINTELLKSWLKTIRRVRNICAHHGRLWNVVLGVYPQLPKSTSVVWVEDREDIASNPRIRTRLYPVLATLQCVLHTISPKSTWSYRLKELLDSHPEIPISAMGFPESWFEDNFWSHQK